MAVIRYGGSFLRLRVEQPLLIKQGLVEARVATAVVAILSPGCLLVDGTGVEYFSAGPVIFSGPVSPEDVRRRTCCTIEAIYTWAAIQAAAAKERVLRVQLCLMTWGYQATQGDLARLTRLSRPWVHRQLRELQDEA
jgi:hypothetical protein